MSDAFRIELDTANSDQWLDGITNAATDAIRPAAQAGAARLYLEARIRVPVSAKAHYFYGKNSKKSGKRYFFEPGALKNAIYQVYSKDNSGKLKATYHIAWNHQKVPYGFMVEFGTSRSPAHPFIRPAYQAAKNDALKIAKNVLISSMEKRT